MSLQGIKWNTLENTILQWNKVFNSYNLGLEMVEIKPKDLIKPNTLLVIELEIIQGLTRCLIYTLITS